MTYQELVEKVKVAYNKAKAVEITEHIAVQVNVEGEASGIFYIEVANGAVNVEPYDYHDHDVLVIASTEVISDIADGKLSVEEAYASAAIRVEGNLGKAALLKQIEIKKASKKAATKTTAKKETTSKKTTVNEEKKPAAKKTATTAKKAETKVEAADTKAAEKKVTATKKTTTKTTTIKATK